MSFHQRKRRLRDMRGRFSRIILLTPALIHTKFTAFQQWLGERFIPFGLRMI